jgi:hypothetical protein
VADVGETRRDRRPDVAAADDADAHTRANAGRGFQRSRPGAR